MYKIKATNKETEGVYFKKENLKTQIKLNSLIILREKYKNMLGKYRILGIAATSYNMIVLHFAITSLKMQIFCAECAALSISKIALAWLKTIEP